MRQGNISTTGEGAMEHLNDMARLRDEILSKVSEYHALKAAERESSFKPGESRVDYGGRVYDEREMLNLVDSALEFWLTPGRYAKQFEESLAAFIGAKWAFMVNSGSSANLLAFSALTSPLLGERRIRRGDEVISVAAAFPTTVAPIVQNGAVPVFVDVELPSANIDCSQLEAALSPKTKAVMLAHTLGNPFDLGKVKAFCERHGLWLIEDNCDSLGSMYAGRQTGSFGHLGTSSFYPPHHMTTGEGGAVYTSDPELRKILLSLRDWGRECHCSGGQDNACGKRFSGQFGSLPEGYDHKYVYSHLGYNLKATEMQAAIGCAQLEKLPSFVEARKRNWRILRDAFAPYADMLMLPEPAKEADPSWFGFLLTVREGAPFSRSEFVSFLEGRKIQTRSLFAGNIIRHPCFEPLSAGEDYRVSGDLKSTDMTMSNSFWLGVYPGLTEAMLEYATDSVKTFLASK